MLALISGGSGSGKSAYAENLAVKLADGNPLYYVATMQCFDRETEQRISRHRQMRKGKGFCTLECPGDIENVLVEDNATLLIECVSNLLANEIYGEETEKNPMQAADKIIFGIYALEKRCNHVIVVTNEIFADGETYDTSVMEYMEALGRINCTLAETAEQVTEVVYSIPVHYKEGGMVCIS